MLFKKINHQKILLALILEKVRCQRWPMSATFCFWEIILFPKFLFRKGKKIWIDGKD